MAEVDSIPPRSRMERLLVVELTTYAYRPETKMEFGKDPVLEVDTVTGEAGFEMSIMDMVWLPLFAT